MDNLEKKIFIFKHITTSSLFKHIDQQAAEPPSSTSGFSSLGTLMSHFFKETGGVRIPTDNFIEMKEYRKQTELTGGTL
jgi:hypothetical protein